MTNPVVTYGSGPIREIPFLNAIIQEELVEASRSGHALHLGWGAKPSGRTALKRAAKDGGHALFLEDGFLRSYGTGGTHPAISLVVDPIGIYYDATRPSHVENMLQSAAEVVGDGPADKKPAIGDVRKAMRLVCEHGLSKYNHAPPLDPARLGAKEQRVLVVDQTAGDLSISLGLAAPETFRVMLQAAIAENPDASIYVKTHPEVVSGKKKGHFAKTDFGDRINLLTDNIEPSTLLREFDRVYVVSSTLGFEALLHGKRVTCFGMPWYAGWGLTDDRVSCPRRSRTRTLEEVFAAGYMTYCRYLNAVTHDLGNIFDAIEWLKRQKDVEATLHGASRRGRLIGVGMRKWKQANLAPLLATLPGGISFKKDAAELNFHDLSPDDSLVSWGAEPPETAVQVARNVGCRLFRMEDGFIRSVGLGSDLIRPQSLVLDEHGIYFDPNRPSELERTLLHGEFGSDELVEAAKLREAIVTQEITKYNLESRKQPAWGGQDRKVILVPGQVEDDASIRLGCPGIRTNLDLLRKVRELRPEAFIVYKPHPDVWSRNRKGSVHRAHVLGLADHIEMESSIISCIANADEVHTLTSLSGFDALLRDKHVVTYGEPFYAGWGLTKDMADPDGNLKRRSRTLTLDELIAGALLRYPLYWDHTLRGYTTAQATVNRIIEERTQLETNGGLAKLQTSFARRQLRKAIILFRAMTSQMV